MKVDPDAEKAKQATDSLTAKLDVYEQILSKQKYIAGDVGAILLPSNDLRPHQKILFLGAHVGGFLSSCDW